MKITYYTADWCMPCQHYKPLVERLADEYGFELEYVDLTDKHEPGIMSIPTLNIDSGEQGVTLVGAYPETRLRQTLEILTPVR